MGAIIVYKVNIVCMGTLKEKYFKDAQEEYLKRIKRFCDIKIVEFNENKLSQNPSQSEIDISLNKECEMMTPYLKGKVFILSLEGKEYSSEEFAKRVVSTFDNFDTITFVIGSSYGISQNLKSEFENICFSKMTFPHHLIRVFLEEQLYRAFTIKNNISYHK